MNQTDPNDSTLDLRPRTARAEQLLDAAMDKLAQQIEEGPISSSMLKQVIELARAAGVQIAQEGQPLSAAGSQVFDPILESMKDLDLEALGIEPVERQ